MKPYLYLAKKSQCHKLIKSPVYCKRCGQWMGNLTTAPVLEVFLEGIYKLLLMALCKDAQRSCNIRVQQPCFMVSTPHTTLQSDSCTAPILSPSGQCAFFSFFSEAIAGCHFPDWKFPANCKDWVQEGWLRAIQLVLRSGVIPETTCKVTLPLNVLL